LDDASISPVALAGAFRPVERGLALIEPLGAPPFTFGRADYDIRTHADTLGAGRCLTLTSRDARRTSVLRRETVVYDAAPYAVTRVGISNEGAKPIRLAALVPFAARGGGRARPARREARGLASTATTATWSPTMSFGGADRDDAPPAFSPEPTARPGRFARTTSACCTTRERPRRRVALTRLSPRRLSMLRRAISDARHAIAVTPVGTVVSAC
jgi:hypothetical protein